MSGTNVVSPYVLIDEERCNKIGIPSPTEKRIGEMTDQVYIDYQEMILNKKDIKPAGRNTLHDLVNMLPRDMSLPENYFVIEFKEGFISYTEMKYPLAYIEFKYKTVKSIERMKIHGDDIIKAIVKDVIEGTEKHIDYTGNVSARKK